MLTFVIILCLNMISKKREHGKNKTINRLYSMFHIYNLLKTIC